MQIGLIGAGNMARALARGWGEPVLCSDTGSGRARDLVGELGGEAFDSNVAVADRADLVVLCHKPAQVDAAIRHGLAPGLAGGLVAETMSGTAALLKTRDYDTLAVRREVTSPGGITARGLAALERAGVRPAFQDAFNAVVGAAR